MINCFYSLSPYLHLNALKYSLILSLIKTNGLIALSKYPIQYLELVFVLTNFLVNYINNINIPSFFFSIKLFFYYLFLQILTLLYYEQKCVIIF